MNKRCIFFPSAGGGFSVGEELVEQASHTPAIRRKIQEFRTDILEQYLVGIEPKVGVSGGKCKYNDIRTNHLDVYFIQNRASSRSQPFTPYYTWNQEIKIGAFHSQIQRNTSQFDKMSWLNRPPEAGISLGMAFGRVTAQFPNHASIWIPYF